MQNPLFIVTESEEKPFYSKRTQSVKKTKEERTYFLAPVATDSEEQEYQKIYMEDNVIYDLNEVYTGFFILNEEEIKNFDFENHAKRAKINQLQDIPVMVTKRYNRIYIYSKNKSNPWKFNTDGTFLEQATYAEIDTVRLGIMTCEENNSRKLSRKSNR